MPAVRPTIIRFATFQLDLEAGELRKNGLRVKLQGQPFRILALLLERPGTVITREELRQRVWSGDTFVEFDDGLNVAIGKLRSALGDSAENSRFIETVPRRGYRFIAPLSTAAEPGDVVHPATAPPFRKRPIRPWLAPVTLAAAVLLASAVFLAMTHGTRLHAGDTAAHLKARRSVAVLGFRNLSGRSDAAWYSTALSEMLSTELRAGEQLRTVPSEQVAQMRINLSLPETDELSGSSLARVHKSLGADLVVVGAYTSMGDAPAGEIRLDVRLQDAVAGETIASISETGKESDLFHLVSRAGAHLREKLGLGGLLPMQVENVRASMPSDPVAARLYSEGLDKFRVFDRVGARDRFLKSIAAEDSFPLSHAALAGAYDSLGNDRNAKEQARKAFDLSADLSREDRLLIKAQYLLTLHEWDKAVDVYKTLFQLFPDNVDYGVSVANTLTSASRGGDALAAVESLRRLPPPSRDDPRIDLAEAEAQDSLQHWKLGEMAFEKTEAKAAAEDASLLVARAREGECFVLPYLGEAARAVAACREAEKRYARAGDHFGEANTLCKWADATAGADPQAAIKLYQESLEMQRSIGSLHGQATAQNEMAIQYSNLGDHATAKKLYLHSLAIFRQQGDKLRVAFLTGNVADELVAMGQVKEAMTLYREEISVLDEMGSKPGTACYNLGTALQTESDLAGADDWFKRALSIFQEQGDKYSSTYAEYSMGEVALARDDLKGARTLLEQSLREREAEQEKISATESRLDLAELALEEGRPAPESEATAAEVAREFHAAKAFDSEALARALLARTLLVARKPAEALRAARDAIAIASHSQDPRIRLSVAITEARVRAAQGNSAETARATASLNRIIAEAGKFGYLPIVLEARLALGEIEIKAGKLARGREHLQLLDKDASSKQFNLIAAKARNATQLLSQTSPGLH